MSAADAEIATQKIEKKPLGKETLDKHPCVKNLSTVKSAKGAVLPYRHNLERHRYEGFSPFRLKCRKTAPTITHFVNVNLAKPDLPVI